MIDKLRIWGTGAGIFMAAMLAAAGLNPALAQKSVEDFYKGKNIDLVISYSRAAAMTSCADGRAIPHGHPGNPTIVRATAGAGGAAPSPGCQCGAEGRHDSGDGDQSLSVAQAMGDKALTDMRLIPRS